MRAIAILSAFGMFLICVRANEGVFNYNDGGVNWNTLTPPTGQTNQCQGTRQSPINIPFESVKRMGISTDLVVMPSVNDKRIGYVTGKSITSEGTWEVLLAADSAGTISAWNQANVHIHSPSEHQLNSKSYDVELHFVHKINTVAVGSYSAIVIALLFTVNGNKKSHFIDQWNWNTKNEESTIDWKDAIRKEFKGQNGYYTYEGSLTTPPCTETVKWIVMDTVLNMSEEQYKAYKSIQAKSSDIPKTKGAGNNRKLQEINGREIKYYSIDFGTLFSNGIKIKDPILSQSVHKNVI